MHSGSNHGSKERLHPNHESSLAAAGLSQIDNSRLRAIEASGFKPGKRLETSVTASNTPLKGPRNSQGHILDAINVGPNIKIGGKQDNNTYNSKILSTKRLDQVGQNRDFNKFMVQNANASTALASVNQLENSSIREYSTASHSILPPL